MESGKNKIPYIALYYLRTSLVGGGGDIVDYLCRKEIWTLNDDEAVKIAESERGVLELIESMDPERSLDIEKTVILSSVHNQSNKRVVFLRGRTE